VAVTLHVVAGPDSGRKLDVDDTLEIGRESSAPVGRLGDDPQLSRHHALIRRLPDGAATIEDLGSSNGTRVNGQLIGGATPLHDGDRVELGSSVLEVRDDTPRQVAAPARADTTAILSPLPPFRMPSDMRHVATRRRRGSTLMAALATALVLAIAGVIVLLVRDDSSAQGDSAGGDYDGTVYVESNNPDPFANSVLAFRYKGGSLRPMQVREYPTNGAGAQDLSNSGALDIDGSIATSTDNKFLFAVNAQSDTIAVFRIQGDGSLKPVKGSPFPSQGNGPASVDYRDGHLFVANKAHDGRRDLKKVAPNYASFKVAGDGSLTSVASRSPRPRRRRPRRRSSRPTASSCWPPTSGAPRSSRPARCARTGSPATDRSRRRPGRPSSSTTRS
jgi:pSer/pThr/pTyr-binding forkhead associated (FHA) protein